MVAVYVVIVAAVILVVVIGGVCYFRKYRQNARDTTKTVQSLPEQAIPYDTCTETIQNLPEQAAPEDEERHTEHNSVIYENCGKFDNYENFEK